MYAQVDKLNEKKRKVVSNYVAQKKSIAKQNSEFIDNKIEIPIQRKQQETNQKKISHFGNEKQIVQRLILAMGE